MSSRDLHGRLDRLEELGRDGPREFDDPEEFLRAVVAGGVRRGELTSEQMEFLGRLSAVLAARHPVPDYVIHSEDSP